MDDVHVIVELAQSPGIVQVFSLRKFFRLMKFFSPRNLFILGNFFNFRAATQVSG